MMKMLFIQLFFILPTFIYGLECESGGKCYGLGSAILTKPIFYNRKTCENACVSFKCIIWDRGNIVMEGAGCFEDFENVCKWTPTKYKEDIKANIKKYSIQNEVLIFQSCNYENFCATMDLENLKTSEEIFGSKSTKLQYPENAKCEYDDTPKSVISNPICSRTIICEPASMYETRVPEDQDFQDDKECEACFDFECTNNGGNTVIAGNGCFDDFIQACPTVPDDIKEKIKANQKDSFYFGDNYLVTSCSNENTIINCNSKYIYSNYWLKENFEANLNITYIDFCLKTIPPEKDRMKIFF